MKKLIFGLGSLFLATSAMAMPEGNEMPEKKNCVKLNLTSLAFSNISLQYERVIHPKMTVALQGRFMIPKVVKNNLVSPDDADVTNLNVGSMALTPEFRFYPKEAMRGFYLAPYMRFRQVSLDFNFPIPTNGGIQTGSFDGRFTGVGGGLMIGVHKQLGNSFSLDFFIIGAQFMSNSMKLTANYSMNLSSADQQSLLNDLNSNLKDFDRFIKNGTASVTASEAKVTGNFAGVGFRGLGLNFGYRF